MKRVAPLVIGAALASAAAWAETAPSDVAFADGAVDQSLTGKPGDAANGRTVVGDKKQGNCVACHQVSDLADVPWHGEIGPPLDGVGDRWSEAELRGIVSNAKMMFEGTMMPSFYRVDGFIRPGDEYTGKAAEVVTPILSAEQVEDVVAYLMTLKE